MQFYLSKSKLDLFSDESDCLGHVIDDNGIHTELDKMRQIREWRVLWNYNKVQKFLGLVQYLALYMPDITAYTTLLSGLVQNNQTFQWTPLLDKCFQSVKAIAMQLPIIKMNQYGSLPTVPKQELVPCMAKEKAGTHVNQQDFYQRNS